MQKPLRLVPASFDRHCSSMTDKRVDPATGSAVTYTELVATYKKQYKRREIEDLDLVNLHMSDGVKIQGS